MKNETKQKNIKTKKHKLNKYYNEWRKISWNTKEYKLEGLNKIDEILDFLEKINEVFVAQLCIRIAYSVPAAEYQIAEKYFLKVVKNEKLFASQADVLGAAYQGLGDLYFEIKQYDKASDIYIELLKTNELEDLIDEDVLQMGIAMVNHSKGIYHDKAEELLLFVYNSDFCDEEMDHLMATKTNYNLGLAKFELKKYKDAKPYLEKALVLYKQRKWNCENIYQFLNSISDDFESEPNSA